MAIKAEKDDTLIEGVTNLKINLTVEQMKKKSTLNPVINGKGIYLIILLRKLG